MEKHCEQHNIKLDDLSEDREGAATTPSKGASKQAAGDKNAIAETEAGDTKKVKAP